MGRGQEWTYIYGAREDKGIAIDAADADGAFDLESVSFGYSRDNFLCDLILSLQASPQSRVSRRTLPCFTIT